MSIPPKYTWKWDCTCKASRRIKTYKYTNTFYKDI